MRISDWSSDVCSSDLAVSPQQSPSPRGLAPAPPAEPRGIPPASQKARTPVTDLNIIDQFMAAFIAYIDSGFGLLGGDVSFLSRTLIAIDVTLAALFWAMGGEDNVLGRSEEHTSELQSLMRTSYAVFCLKKKTYRINTNAQK